MKQKGGLSEIIASVILVGIVLAVLISAVIPMAQSTKDTTKKGNGFITNLNEKMGQP